MKKILFLILLLFIIGCTDIMENQELQGKKLVEASCDDLYESMKKCDTTGVRFDSAREQCKTNHLIIIMEKCKKDKG